MAANSEKTHAKNLENLHIANTIVASIGAAYNPSNPLLKVQDLTSFEETFSNLMQNVNEALTLEQGSVGKQIAAFREVSSRVARIMKAAKAQGLTTEYMANLQSTSYRLNGVRVSEKTPDNPGTPENESRSNHSVSQRSYAGILESLDLFEEQLKSNPAYKPNEEAYQTPTISAWIAGLGAKHNDALATKVATRAARNARNSFAYNPTTGLLVRMNALKAYCETILEKTDSRLKQLKKLKFIDYSK